MARRGVRQLGALVERAGVAQVAARLGVSPATVERWQRRGVPERRRSDVAGAKHRSDVAVERAERVQRERRRRKREEHRRRLKAAKKGAKTRKKRDRAAWDPKLRKALAKPKAKPKKPGGRKYTPAELDRKHRETARKLATPAIELLREQSFKGQRVRRVRMVKFPDGWGVAGVDATGAPLRGWASVNVQTGEITVRWMLWIEGARLPKVGARDVAETYAPLQPTRYRVQATWGAAA